MRPQFAARLHVLLAPNSPEAVVIRRGPAPLDRADPGGVVEPVEGLARSYDLMLPARLQRSTLTDRSRPTGS